MLQDMKRQSTAKRDNAAGRFLKSKKTQWKTAACKAAKDAKKVAKKTSKKGN